MAKAQFQVTHYSYYNWSSRKVLKTNLVLKGVSGQRCSVWFSENENEELQEALMHSDISFSLYYHHSQLDHLIDMLRNESPIHVYFNNDHGFSNSRISTGDEPIGDGEES
ncbi:MAG: hypothetical protein KUG78_20290 [Kangiellaceae bacterium]|nr:hypothetical protein [Kangiellaceae bacterium]